jgi:hypothetical protein
MVAELTQMFSSLKLASDFIKGFNSLKTETALNEAKIELTNIILSLQSNASSLQEKYDEIVRSKNELEKKLTELRNFDSEKKKYELKNIITGVIAYVPKEEKDRVNDKHWLCQNCLDNFQRFTIYQVEHKSSDNIRYYCPNCKSSFVTKNPDYQQPPEITFRP